MGQFSRYLIFSVFLGSAYRNFPITTITFDIKTRIDFTLTRLVSRLGALLDSQFALQTNQSLSLQTISTLDSEYPLLLMVSIVEGPDTLLIYVVQTHIR